jgi:hypothetical protein
MDWFKCDWEEDRESTQINQMVMLGSDGEVVAYHWLEGQYDRLPSLMADVISRGVAVIATPGSNPAALAANAVTTTIPMVFGVGEEPASAAL